MLARPSRRALRAHLALTGLALFTAAPASADDGVETGRRLAERLCASCHLNPGQGEKSGPEGIPGFYAVARRPDQTAEAIVDWLRSVPPMMPDHHLTQDEMVALSQFIMSLRDTPP
jgi:mono/diheme cytochrome c family protein